MAFWIALSGQVDFLLCLAGVGLIAVARLAPLSDTNGAERRRYINVGLTTLAISCWAVAVAWSLTWSGAAPSWVESALAVSSTLVAIACGTLVLWRGDWRRATSMASRTIWAMLVTIVSLWIVAAYRDFARFDRLRVDLLDAAVALSDVLPADSFSALDFAPGDADRSEFRAMGAEMSEYARAIGARSVYSFRRSGTSVVFGPESLEPTDSLASPPGTVYERPPAEVGTVLDEGVATFTSVYADEYGTFVSAFAPVGGDSGARPVAAIGIDLPWDGLQRFRAEGRWQFLVLAVFAGLLLLLGGWSRRFVTGAGLGSSSPAWVTDSVVWGMVGTVLSLAAYLYTSGGIRDSREALMRQVAETRLESLRESFELIRGGRLDSLAEDIEVHKDSGEIEFRRRAERFMVASGMDLVARVEIDHPDNRVATPIRARLIDFVSAAGEDHARVPAGVVAEFDAVAEGRIVQSLRDGEVVALNGRSFMMPEFPSWISDQHVVFVKPISSTQREPVALLIGVMDIARLSAPEDRGVKGSRKISLVSLGSRLNGSESSPSQSESLVLPFIVGGQVWPAKVQVDFDDETPGSLGFPLMALLAGLVLTSAGVWIAFNRALGRRELEREVQRQTAVLYGIIDSMTEVVFFKDQLGRYMGGNSRFLSRFAKDRTSLRGLMDVDLFPAERAQRFQEDDQRVVASGESITTKQWVRDVTGTESLFETVKSPLRDQSGAIIGVLGVARDRTLAHRDEEVLRENVDRFRSLFDDDRLPKFLVDPDRRLIVDANRAARSFYGYGDALIGMSLDRVNTMSAGEIAQRVAEARNHHQNSFLFKHRLADGDIRDVEVHSIPITIRGQTYLMSTILDVTARLDAETGLRQSRQNFEVFFNSIEDMLFVLDTEGAIIAVNETVRRRLGYSDEELVGKSVLNVHPVESRSEAAATVTAMLEGIVQSCPIPVQKKDGSLIAVETRVVRGQWNGQDALFGVTKDITELRLSEERFKKTFHSNSALMALSNVESGRFIEVNMSFLSTLGYSRDEVIGKTSVELGLFPDVSQRGVMINELKSTGRLRNRDVTVRRRDGTTIEGLFSADFVHSGEQTHMLTVMQDVTPLKEATRQATEASQTKSLFLANMSHEIRTPINGIVGLSSLLVDIEGSPRHAEFARLIQNNATQLLDIINDILDFSKIEAGRLDMDRLRFEPKRLLDDALAIHRVAAGNKALSLDVEITADVPATLIGDPSRLRQVLSNLVGNAVKFTEKGGVSVRACVASDQSAPGRHLRVEVRDTGIGIAPDVIGKLFQPFTQADASTTRRFGGTGLGLSICRELVTRMGGTIRAESREGQGSLFWFELPLDPMVATDGPAVETWTGSARLVGYGKKSDSPGDYSGRGLRVLVADDNITNQMVARLMLEQAGLAVDVVGDGAEALAATEHVAYHLVLMDVQMPGMDGIEATRRVRARERERGNARVPIMALTAYAFPEDRERCLSAGMDDYVAKPITREAIHTLVARWLPAGESVPASASSVLDVEALAKRLGGDPTFVSRLLGVFRADAEKQIAMLLAIESPEPGVAKSMGHRLKGAARNVGANRLAEVAATIESFVGNPAEWKSRMSALEETWRLTKESLDKRLGSDS